MSELIFPLRQRPDHDYTTGGRKFGASRSSGNRLHAACDLIAPAGTEILAMADGTVIRGPYDFYGGTCALEVKHTNGMVVRYGEISKLVPPGIVVGASVTQGQVIARVGRLDSGSSMLHLELYQGTESGPLTQTGDNKYKRRGDLIDPTPHLDAAPLLDELGAQPAPASAPAGAIVDGRVNTHVTSALRVRATPSRMGELKFELRVGDPVRVRAQVTGDVYDFDRRDWLEIEHGGKAGFAAAYYIDIGTTAPPAVTEDKWVAALRRARTNGASAKTAAQDGLAPGAQASRTMAETDFNRVVAIAGRFASAAAKFGIPGAVLAALASRESRCGAVLFAGWGDNDNAFGILQIDKRHHSIKGQPDPASLEHIEQAADIFCDGLEEVAQRHPDWKDEHVLQGAAVAYNSGVGNVQSLAGMDTGTTGDDYGADVLARAQYYLDHPRLSLFRG